MAAALVPSFPAPGAALMAGIMAVTFLGVYRYREAALAIPPGRVVEVMAILAAFPAMTVAGLLLALVPASGAMVLLFGAVMTAVMAGELYFVARSSLLRLATREPYDPGPVRTAVPTGSP